MDRTARHFGAILDSLFLRVQSRKGREQGWMDIQNPARKRSYEFRREQTHIAGQADQIDSSVLQCRSHLPVMLLAQAALGGYELSIQPAPLRILQPRRVGPVGNDNCNLGMQPPGKD